MAGDPARLRILRSATEAMSRAGAKRTTMRDVAARSGVSRSLIHYYFKGKEDLLAEVVAALEDEVDEYWRRAVAEHDDPWDRLAASLRALAELYRERPKFWDLLIELFVASRRNPKLQPAATRLVNRLLGELRAEVALSTAKLPVPTPVPPDDAATMIAALMYGTAVMHLVDGRDPERALRAFLMVSVMAGGLTYVLAGEDPPLDRLFGLVAEFAQG